MSSRSQANVRELRPFAVVEDLRELRGPSDGVLTLSHLLYWGPNHDFDISLDADAASAYTAILNEGTIDDVRQLINAARLVAVWPTMSLPLRVLHEWEQRHTQLRQEWPRELFRA